MVWDVALEDENEVFMIYLDMDQIKREYQRGINDP
jgi:hypothetical protein